MRRITLSVAVLALVALLASAGTVRADEPETQDLVIGLPPPCGDEEAVSLSAVDCAGVEPVEAIGPIAPEIEAAAAETARVETALVASQGPEALRRNCRFHAEVSSTRTPTGTGLRRTSRPSGRTAPITTSRSRPSRATRRCPARIRRGESERSARASMRWPRHT